MHNCVISPADDGVRRVVACRQLQHPVCVHGAEVPADFCTDASEVNDRSQPQQSAARADRV